MLMLAVFIFLSIHLANRTLVELSPSGGQMVLKGTNGQADATYTLNAAQAVQIAGIIDSAPYINLENKTELAEIELTFDKAERMRYTLTPEGVISFRGWYNQRKLAADNIQKIIAVSVSSLSPVSKEQ